MPTTNRRLEKLEERKPQMGYLVLWGDADNPDICRVDGEVFTWSEAKRRFGNDYVLMCVRHIDYLR